MRRFTTGPPEELELPLDEDELEELPEEDELLEAACTASVNWAENVVAPVQLNVTPRLLCVELNIL